MPTPHSEGVIGDIESSHPMIESRERSNVYPYKSESESNPSPNLTSTNAGQLNSPSQSDSIGVITELKSLLDDISISCESSVLILDDLLLYDKIESGNLSLRYEKVAFMDHLMKWIKVYQLEVQ